MAHHVIPEDHRILSTTEAAYLAGIELKYFTEWARIRGLQPLGRVRDGRSFVTLWSYEALLKVDQRRAA